MEINPSLFAHFQLTWIWRGSFCFCVCCCTPRGTVLLSCTFPPEIWLHHTPSPLVQHQGSCNLQTSKILDPPHAPGEYSIEMIIRMCDITIWSERTNSLNLKNRNNSKLFKISLSLSLSSISLSLSLSCFIPVIASNLHDTQQSIYQQWLAIVWKLISLLLNSIYTQTFQALLYIYESLWLTYLHSQLLHYNFSIY